MKKKNKVIPVLLTGIALAIGIAISNAVIQNSFVLDEANAVTNTVTYSITAKNTVTASGSAPVGSSATLVETYTTSKQITKDNSQTLTLSGWSGHTISAITLSMKSNASDGAGNFTYSIDGGTNFSTLVSTAKFNTASWYGSWSTSYVSVSKTGLSIAASSANLVFKISATVNSLYCQSYSFTYVKNQTLQSISVVTPPTKTSYFVGESLDPTGLVIQAAYDVGDPVDVTSSCTFSPLTFSEAGSNISVTASYTDGGVTKTASIEGITVVTRNLVSIAVSTNPTKVAYVIGESFSSTGMVITATYDAGDPVVGYTNYSYSPTTAFGTAGAKTITITSLDNASITTSLIVQVTSSQSMSITVTDTGATISGYQTKTFSKNGSTFVIANIINTSGNIQMQANTFSMHNSTALAGYLSKITIHKASGTPTSMTLYSGTASQESSTSGGTACVFNSSTNTFSWDINASLKHTYFRLFNLLGSGTMTFSSIDIEYLLPPAVDDDAVAYGTSFLSATASGCSTASSATLSGVWADLESSYNALSSDAKAYLTSLTPNASGNDAEHAVARYIHIITKYGEATFVDFMNLDIQAAPTASNILDINSNDFLPLISVIGIIGLTVIIGYYYHNKKKEA